MSVLEDILPESYMGGFENGILDMEGYHQVGKQHNKTQVIF